MKLKQLNKNNESQHTMTFASIANAKVEPEYRIKTYVDLTRKADQSAVGVSEENVRSNGARTMRGVRETGGRSNEIREDNVRSNTTQGID